MTVYTICVRSFDGNEVKSNAWPRSFFADSEMFFFGGSLVSSKHVILGEIQ